MQFHKKSIITHPMEGHRKFLGREEAKYEAKLEFPGGGGGGGVQNKKPSVGGVWIFFWNCTLMENEYCCKKGWEKQTAK